MSGLVGKGTKSYRKKNVAESNIPAIGIKTIKWVIQRTDTGTPGSPGVQNRFLNWTSLVGVPTELGDFQQPSVSTIQRLFTGQFRNNLRVVSNYNGELIDFDTYEVSDAGIILDGDYTIEPDADLGDEYIVFEFNRGAVTGNRIVDARPLRASGEIDLSVIAADTPFNFDVGQFFKIAGSVVDSDDIDSQQIGNVQVFVNGILQFRNTGNTDAADVESDETDNIEGNYQEVNGSNNNDGSTGGVANAIRFNKKEDFPGVTEINVMVISTNLIVDNPESITLQDGIDGLQSEIDNLDTTTATSALTRANRKEIFNLQVTGDFTSLAPIAFGSTSTPSASDNIVSLAMNRANEAYTLNSFTMTITNEFNTTGDGTIEVLLQTSLTGTFDTDATWNTIGTATSVNGATPTISGFSSVPIPVGTYVRLRPTDFGTVTPSFHIGVSGTVTA